MRDDPYGQRTSLIEGKGERWEEPRQHQNILPRRLNSSSLLVWVNATSIQSACTHHIRVFGESVHRSLYSDASMSTEYGSSGFGSGRTGGEQTASMNVFNATCWSSFNCNLSGLLFRSSLRGWAFIPKALMNRLYTLQSPKKDRTYVLVFGGFASCKELIFELSISRFSGSMIWPRYSTESLKNLHFLSSTLHRHHRELW